MNTVIGNITEIRRKDKIVVINDEVYLPYDLLFFMTGEIFQRPENLYKSPLHYKPQNLFMINNSADASHALTKLKSLSDRFETNDCELIGIFLIRTVMF